MGEVSAPRNSRRELSWSASQTVWFLWPLGPPSQRQRPPKCGRVFNTDPGISTLNCTYQSTRLVSSPPHPSCSLSCYLAFPHMEPAAWEAQPAVTQQIYFSFQYPGKVLHSSRGDCPEYHSSTQTQKKFFFKIYLFGYGGSSLVACGLSLVAENGSYFSFSCIGFSLRWFPLLQSTGCRYASLSSCSTRARDLWHTSLVAAQHVGSSRTRDRTGVPRTARLLLNHWATREAPNTNFYFFLSARCTTSSFINPANHFKARSSQGCWPHEPCRLSSMIEDSKEHFCSVY